MLTANSLSVTDWLPAVDGFWGERTKNSLAYAGWPQRREWMLSQLPDDATRRCTAAVFADGVLHLFENHRPKDSRPRDAIRVARRFAFGLASNSELSASADDAALAADAAYADAAYTAAYAAEAAALAADAAAAYTAAYAAYAAAYAAADDAYAAAYAAADDAARLTQARLLSLFTVPAWTISEDARGLARGAVTAFFRDESMQPYLLLLSDALQEAGNEYDYRIRTMQEWDGFTVGMYPLVPSVVGSLK